MTRPRNAREQRDLTESWDDMGDSYEGDSLVYDDDEERDEVGEEYKPRMNGHRASREEAEELPRRRTLRSSVEPELVMPASPNARDVKTSNKGRASTPHFRMNERSLTSDAGEIRRKTRSSTPRFRMGDRSMTGDAGRMRSSKLRNQAQEAEYDSDDETAAHDFQWQNAVRAVFQYFSDLFAIVMHNMKPVLGFLIGAGLVVYLVGAAAVFTSGFLTNSLTNALSPICRLPFTSSLPFCPEFARPELQGSAEFDKLVQAQTAFEDVLAGSSVGSSLPTDMKRSEASIRDLKHVVQYSHLPSRNELVFEFTGFIETARQASSDLSRFNSRIGRAVDHILSTNRWTLSVVNNVNADEASRGALEKFFGKINIFAPFQPISLSRDVLLDQYLRHTSAVEEQILSLIDEALALRAILDNLDGRLDVIEGIVTRDGIKVSDSKDELLSSLWTMLGGNRAGVKKLKQQLTLLNDVSMYRKLAWGHVTSTLMKLQEIQASLEDLRERVAQPETIGTDKIPLEVHIEAINLGIERLESQRDVSRKLEAENLARITSKSGANDRQLIENGQDLKEL